MCGLECYVLETSPVCDCHGRRFAGRDGTEEGGHARGLFAEELAAKAEAAGAQMSPWACRLGKSYTCDQYSGPPTREFGAFSPSSNRPVACAV